VLPLPCSLLDSEEMRLEIEKMKETDALTEAIREFGKVGSVHRLLLQELVLSCSMLCQIAGRHRCQQCV
jgi:hypothetical protein